MHIMGHHAVRAMVISLRKLRRRWAIFLALALLLGYSPWLARTLSPAPLKPEPYGIISHFSGRGRWVALAFANVGLSPAVVGDLAQAGVHATFFVTGMSAARNKRWIRLARRMGDDIESHTEGHINLAVHPYSQDLADLRAAQTAIQESGGIRPRWLFPPYEAIGPAGLHAARMLKLGVILPSHDTIVSTGYSTTDLLVHQVLEAVKPGAIVVLDDLGPQSGLTAALPRILSLLAIKGYHVGSVTELWRRSR